MISRTVKGILAFTSTPPEVFWHAVGMSRSTYYNRINGETPWSAADVAQAADALGVTVADLYAGNVPLGLPQWGSDSTMDTAHFPESDDQPSLPGLESFPFPRAAGDANHDRIIDLREAAAA